MKRLYIDFDGVILNTMKLLYNAFQISGANWNSKLERDRFFETYDYSLIINDENILNDSIECINKLIDSKMFEISILTHINSLAEGCEKVNYLRKKFEDVAVILVPKELSKTKLVNSKNAILVDDYSDNLKEWEKSGGIAIKFSTELESDEFKTINRLDELINIFKEDKNDKNN